MPLTVALRPKRDEAPALVVSLCRGPRYGFGKATDWAELPAPSGSAPAGRRSHLLPHRPNGSGRARRTAAERRKMCVVLHTPLARGPAARPRCIPPACGSSRASSPFRSQWNVSPFHHSQGDFALPAPIDSGAFKPPGPLSNPARIGCAPPFRRWITIRGRRALKPTPATPAFAGIICVTYQKMILYAHEF